MATVYVDQQQAYSTEPVPEYVIPSNRVFPQASGMAQLPYRGSQGPYGIPGNQGQSAGINSGVPDATSAHAYGQAVASGSPSGQPLFWMVVAMVIGVAMLAYGAHMRVKG
jgi:hypothetical protein